MDKVDVVDDRLSTSRCDSINLGRFPAHSDITESSVTPILTSCDAQTSSCITLYIKICYMIESIILSLDMSFVLSISLDLAMFSIPFFVNFASGTQLTLCAGNLSFGRFYLLKNGKKVSLLEKRVDQKHLSWLNINQEVPCYLSSEKSTMTCIRGARRSSLWY